MHSLGNNAHAQATHRQWSRDAHKHTRTHSLTINGHVTRAQEHAHAQAHAHALSLTFNGPVMATPTHASPTLTFISHVMHPRARITHPHPSTHASHTPSRAHTQANAQEHELSQSSVIRCTLVHAHARAHTHSRACALNTPEAYFYYYWGL